MKFAFASAAALLLAAEAVLATPVTLMPRTPRASKRGAGGLRRTRPMEGVEAAAAVAASHGAHPAAAADTAATNETEHVAYSANWAGAVLVGSGYQSVTGTFTVPTPQEPTGGSQSTEYAASAWVGLDGDTCQTAILQTGIDFNVQGSQVSFDAWYEWYPDYAYTFVGFGISAGDRIRLTATAATTTSGRVLIENLTTGRSASHSFSGESAALCETNAEWIVEDFEQGGGLVPFANFGSVSFTDATVTTTSGSTIGVTGATILDIRQSNTVLTSCATSGNESVTCSYV